MASDLRPQTSDQRKNIPKLPKLPTLLTFLTFLTISCASPSEPISCEESLTIDGSKAFAQMLIQDDSAELVLIKAAGREQASPILDVEALSGYQFKEGPLLWTDADQQQMMVDDRAFSDLQTLSAVDIKSVSSIGNASPELVASWGYAKILQFLLEAEVVRSYWHLDAELCLQEVHETDAVYEERYSAVHSYCTNECIEAPYTFALRIQKDSGKIQLRPY